MRKLLSLVAVATALLPTAVGATTVRALSTEAMTAEAEVIAIGRCVSIAPVWEDRVLVTHATVEITESLKGDVSGSIVVSLPGGIDTNRKVKVAMTYPGAPTMQPGEQVFLFLDREADDPTSLTVSGFAQGKFSVVADPSGVQYVSRDLRNLTLVTGAGQSAGTTTRTPLGAFRQEIKRHLAR
jgi:hypothetical protein